MNITMLTGNATKDVELRYNQNGTAIANGTIAVRRKRKDQNGEYKSDFHNFIAFGKPAEILANYVKKGDKFGINGELQNRVWEKENGEKRYFTEIIIDGFDLPSKNSGGQANQQQQSGGNQGYTRIEDDPFANQGETYEVNSDDLPF